MSWYYAESGRQLGPVDDATLAVLVNEGRISSDTLIWREGMPNWLAYSQSAAASLAQGTQPPLEGAIVATTGGPTAQCRECGRVFSNEELIEIEGRQVCATCKPVVVQKLKEGVLGTEFQTADPEALAQGVLRRGYQVNIGSLLGRAWKLLTANFLPSVGVFLLAYLIMIAASNVPFLGIVTAVVVQPQLMAGLYWYYLRQHRGEESTVNNVFDGFRRGFGEQALYAFLMFMIMLAAVAGCVAPMFIIPGVTESFAELGQREPPAVGFWIFLGVVGVVVLIMTYLFICWLFTPLLILDKGIRALPAMNLSRRAVGLHFWKIFLLIVVLSLLGFAGMLALLIGALVAAPLSFFALTGLYEEIFSGPRTLAETDSCG